jgi:hypothetical protein
MSVPTIRYAPTLAADSARGPSMSIWSRCPVLEFQQDPDQGTYFFDDFTMLGNADMTSAYKNSIGQWSTYGYAGALLADGAAEGGVVTYGSDGDNEGVCFLSSAGSFRLVTTSTLALNGKLWFETRIATSTVTATTHEDFVGLAIPALSSGLPRAAYPITTTDDTLDATNGTFIGFHRKATAAPTEWQFVFNLAGGTINYPTGLTTLMNSVTGAVLTAAQFVKLGFLFDPGADYKQITSATARQTAGQVVRPLITVFVNGQPAATFLSSADVQNATSGQKFPTGFMAPCFANMNQTGTTPGTSSVDWIRVAQRANS